MKKKMGIEGVGPKIMVLLVIFYIIAYFINNNYPDVFVIQNNVGSLNWLIIILAIIGIVLWLTSAVMMLMYFPKGKLITSGPFKLFLNPLYNSFILFIMPAISLYLNSWIYFGASAVMFIAELTLGKAEEKYLSETFGKEYTSYRKKVWFKI